MQCPACFESVSSRHVLPLSKCRKTLPATYAMRKRHYLLTAADWVSTQVCVKTRLVSLLLLRQFSLELWGPSINDVTSLQCVSVIIYWVSCEFRDMDCLLLRTASAIGSWVNSVLNFRFIHKWRQWFFLLFILPSATFYPFLILCLIFDDFWPLAF